MPTPLLIKSHRGDLRLNFVILAGLSIIFFMGSQGCTSENGNEYIDSEDVPGAEPNQSLVHDSDNSILKESCPQYPQDFSFVEVPDPLAEQNPTYPLIEQPFPAVGECIADPSFGTHMKRVTAIDGINGRHEYSRIDAFNVDQTMILLMTDEGTQKVYRTDSLPYNLPSNLVLEIEASEPRWDPLDPLAIWAFDGFKIIKINVAEKTTVVIKDFSGDPVMGPEISSKTAYRITSMDEGESSLDKRFWALALQGNESKDYRYLRLFTWDALEDKILGIYPQDRELKKNEADIDWIGMSPLGNWALIGALDSNNGEIIGLTLVDKALTHFRRLDYTTAHADVGLDCLGKEVVVMQNTRTDYIDMIPLDLDVNTIPEQDDNPIATGHIPIVRLNYDSESSIGLNSGVHISCNVPCFCAVSTNIAPDLPAQNWLDRSLVLVKLAIEHPGIYYLAKVHNTTSEEPRVYWDETQASISRDGSRIIWVENWGKNIGETRIFLMELEMPENWRDLTGKSELEE